jgi:hypothetical protein
MTPTQIAELVWTLSRQKCAMSGELATCMVERAIATSRRFRAREIGMLLSGLVQGGWPVEEKLRRAMMARAMLLRKEFLPFELANMLWALSKQPRAEGTPQAKYDWVRQRERKGNVDPDLHFLLVMVEQAEEKSEVFHPVHIAMLLSAVVKWPGGQKAVPASLWRSMSYRCVEAKKKLKQTETAQVLRAYYLSGAKMDEKFVRVMTGSARRHAETMHPDDVSTTLHSLACMHGYVDAKLLEGLIDRALLIWKRFDAVSVARMLFGLAKARAYNGQLTELLCKRARDLVDEMSPKMLGQITEGLVRQVRGC